MRGPGAPKSVVDDWKQFEIFLASQPFCKWCLQKEREMALRESRPSTGGAAAAGKQDNADLLAALASMA